MANENMEAIQTTSVGSGGASQIVFNSIPQTYTDLYIICSSRSTYGAVTDSFTVRFNGDTGTNYDYRGMRLGNGSAAISYNKTTYGVDNNFYMIDTLTGATNTSNTFSNVIIHIPNYTSSNQKSLLMEGASEGDSTTTDRSVRGQFSGKWNNTAAITAVRLAPFNGNFTQYSTATLYGNVKYTGETGGKATGGIVTSDSNYWYHTFTSSGIFTPTESLSNVDYLVVAGGGGSGYQISGGGGAGGVRCTVGATGGGGSLPAKVSFTNATPYTILVGAGGAVGTSGVGTSGSSSYISGSGFSTISCTGGGGSGHYDSADAALSGGSGGGGAATAGGTTRTGGAGTANEGFAGGNGTNIGSPPYQAGSGGGAGEAGRNSNNASGAGGNGIQTSISGTATYYGGGGGAASYNPPKGHAGGLGGGGAGNSSTNNQEGTNGVANTGGGGGGNGIPGAGNAVGSGGSGIVILRIAK